MSGYSLLTYEVADGSRAGVAIDDWVYDLATLTGRPQDVTLLGFITDWDTAKARLAAALAGGPTGEGTPLAQIRLLAPVLYPGAIYCAGANYSDHAAEMNARQGRPPDPDPHTLGLKAWHFVKASRAVAHPDATVELPRASKAVDWEAELAAVIGRTRPCRRLSLRQRPLGARPRYARTAAAGQPVPH